MENDGVALSGKFANKSKSCQLFCQFFYTQVFGASSGLFEVRGNSFF